jgi:hypothetical protein
MCPDTPTRGGIWYTTYRQKKVEIFYYPDNLGQITFFNKTFEGRHRTRHWKPRLFYSQI